MFKIILTAGIDYTKDGHAIAGLDVRMAAINTHIAATFGGYTLAVTRGGWINPQGQLIEEQGRQWQVYAEAMNLDEAERAAFDLAEFIAAELDQDTVVAEVQGAVVGFAKQAQLRQVAA